MNMIFERIKTEILGYFTHTVVENDPYSHLCSIHTYTAKYYKYWEPEYTHASIQDQAPVEGFGRAATVKNIYKKPIILMRYVMRVIWITDGEA